MPLTPSQCQAIRADGNILVLAGAGAGKTKTLIDRCWARLTDAADGASLDQMLLVTFTEAAAAEMKQRLRARLAEQCQHNPGCARFQEQLLLLESAPIGTLHSFCLRLIKEHFHVLGIDPQSSVMAEEQRELVMQEVLDELFEEQYSQEQSAHALHDLVQVQGRGKDEFLRGYIQRVHAHTQTLAQPARWFEQQQQLLDLELPDHWMGWMRQALASWCECWVPVLSVQPADCIPGWKSLDCLKQIAAAAGSEDLDPAGSALAEILRLNDLAWPTRRKTELRQPIARFFEEAQFFKCFFDAGGAPGSVPLKALIEDWTWVRGQMQLFLELSRQFSIRFTEAKRQMGMLDFQDLEQLTLALLVEEDGQPSAVAKGLRRHFRFVFVDEYQDINAAQDAILRSISREPPQGNRFLVGDIKQSIYRFRLANPEIFREYQRTWESDRSAGQVIRLVDNFRSREIVLQFINKLFSALLPEGVGAVSYPAEDHLQFGAAAERALLSASRAAGPRTELHFLVESRREESSGDELGEAPSSEGGPAGQLDELTACEKEARWIAQRLQTLQSERHPVWDEQLQNERPIQWRDMVVLLRAPSALSDIYAKVFARAGVPLHVGRGDFFQSAEVSDLVSVLMLLDNPLQDIPLLAALRSPMVGLSLNELATIRLASKQGPFWIAFRKWLDRRPEPNAASELSALREKAACFAEQLQRWRGLSRHASITRQLDAIVQESKYLDWIATQPRPEERRRNISQLLQLADQFDPFERQGVQRFVRFIELQQSLPPRPEPLPEDGSDAVRLLSVHQSKGLEFPLVVVAALGRRFNFREFAAPFILDDEYGLCPQIQPPESGRFYPSLPYWLARNRQKQQRIEEEIRLLYVAMTRARDTLLLSGTLSERQFSKWADAQPLTPLRIFSANRPLEWIVPWWSRQVPAGTDSATSSGKTDLFTWTLQPSGQTAFAEESRAAQPLFPTAVNPEAWRRLSERLSFEYPFLAATREPAKASVMRVSRKLQPVEESAAWPLVDQPKLSHKARLQDAAEKLSPAEIGIAHHVFLQNLGMKEAVDISREFLSSEAARMRREQLLSATELDAVDLESVWKFLDGDVGRQILNQREHVQREIPFTARFRQADLAAVAQHGTESGGQLEGPDPRGLESWPIALEIRPESEFIVLQGVVDLAVIQPQEIWILDFKTDQIRVAELESRVRQHRFQLRVYALALERIYRRPVSHLWLHFLAVQKTIELKPIVFSKTV